MVTKQCPKCQKHLPVACKACPCGHVFFVTRRPTSNSKSNPEDGGVKRRRTERTKRERPDYFNSLKIENQLKKVRNQKKSRKKSENVEKDCEGSNSEGSEGNKKRSSLNIKQKKRGRPKKSPQDKSESSKNAEEEVDMFANLSKEKEQQFGVILSEINWKMQQQCFQID